MSEQIAMDFVSAPAYRQVARREYVMRRVAENRERFRADFGEWLKSNLHVWERFEHEANRVWEAGRRHYSARTIGEVLRHETALAAANDGEWKLNDHRWPCLARLYMLLHEDRPDFFETRGRAA